MSSKRSSIDPSTHKNPNPNPNPNPSPKKKHKKKKSKHTDQNPNPSPSSSPMTPKKETPMAVGHLPAPTDSPATKRRRSKDSGDGDSLAILEAVIKFQSANGGNNPTPTNMKPLYDSLKGSLHADYTMDQLYNCIRKLRARYNRLLDARHVVGDSVPNRAFFDLSARAWGGSRKKSVTPSPIANGTAAPAPKKSKTEEKEKEKDDDCVDGSMDDAEGDSRDSFKFLYHHAKEYWGMTGMNPDNMETGLKWMDRGKAKVLERKWVQHGEVGFKIQGKQSELETDLFLTLFAAQKGMN